MIKKQFILILFILTGYFTAGKAQTIVTIRGEQFLINNKLTYPGRSWKGNKIEGLLLNSRMIQGIFDDQNPETVKNWQYADTKKWDADRNTNELSLP